MRISFLTARGRRVLGLAAVLLTLGAAGAASAQSADLLVAQQVITPTSVPAGGIATVAITVENNGTGAASNVTLTETLPSGSTLMSMTASDGGTCSFPGNSNPPYTCNWANIPFPGARTVTLQVLMPAAGVFPNVASVASDTPDPNTGNQSLSRNITVIQAADLGITATSTQAGNTIAAGQPYSYTVAVANHGPNAIPAGQTTTVTFNAPSGSTLTSVPTGSGWTCTPAGVYPLTTASGATGTQITCTRSDALANGSSFPNITVPAVGNATGNVAATFNVSSTFPDGVNSNNVDTENQPLSDGTDMAITKTVALAAGGSGTRATFTLQARQNGGSAPDGVVVTDTLPAGMTYVSHTADDPPWTCDFGATTANTLTCAYQGTYNGGPFTNLPPIQLVADVTAQGSIPNSGIVTATPTDPVGANNTSTVSVDNSADLGITKTASLNPVVVNQSYNWGIVVRNYGPMPVLAGQYITVTESIPAGMRITAAGGTGWACYSDSGHTTAAVYPVDGATTLYCRQLRASNLGFNASSGTATDTLTLTAVNTVDGALTNSACLGLSGNGPVEAGDAPSFQRNCHGVGTTGTTGDDSADLRIVKTVAPDPVVVGQPLTYTLTVTNLSTVNAATNVHVYDTVNNLLSSVAAPGLVSATATQGSCTPAGPSNVTSASIDCNLGTLAANGVATVTIVVRPANTTAADLNRSNTATVNSLDVGDPNRGNNSSTITSVVQPRVDMTVSKSVNPGTVRVGEPMTYTITASNAGPSTATNVTITDVMPANTAFISVGTPSNGGVCGTVPAVDSEGGTLVCTWASVPASSQRTVTFTVRPLAAALGTTITNTVVVATDSIETDLNNNEGSIEASVIASEIDILVEKTDSVDPVVLGAMTRYTVAIRNLGPSYGTHLVMTDTFPAAGNSAVFSYRGNLTASIAGVPVAAPDCDEPADGATTGTLVCRFPTIAIGDANEVLVEYDMRAEGIVTIGDYAGTQYNDVTVAVDENEIEIDNNTVSEATTTRRDPIPTDLGLTKTVDRAIVAPGQQVTYTLTVVNNGPLESLGAQVIDPLPAGLSFVSSPDGCVDNGGTVICPVGALAVGDSVTFHFTAQLDSPYTGPSPLVNRAELDAPGDTDPSNNEDEAEVEVPGEPPAPPVPVPGLDGLGLALLGLLMAGAVGWGRRRYR